MILSSDVQEGPIVGANSALLGGEDGGSQSEEEQEILRPGKAVLHRGVVCTMRSVEGTLQERQSIRPIAS